MKKFTHIPAILALLFLIGGCTLPAVRGSTSRMERMPTAETPPPPEPPAIEIVPETQEKRVSLIPKDNAEQTARETPPVKPTAPVQEAQPAQTEPPQPPTPQPQVFTDYNTGLVFTYPRPWHLVSTQGAGPVLGRDGHSQLTARFVTLTSDKNKGGYTGYFHVPHGSLRGTIGKTLKSILGVEDEQTTSGNTPLDVLLTEKHFPSLIVEKRFRGNNGGIVVQHCRHRKLPGQIQVYHIFIEDKVASFSLSDLNNRQFKLEMQQIVLSTKKP